MRSFSLRSAVTFLVLGLVVACSDEVAPEGHAPIPPAPAGEGGAANSDAPPSVEGEAAAQADVKGTVIDYLDKPIAGCPVLVVDAKGKKIEATTDGYGAFVAKGVSVPYDLEVAPPPSATEGFPRVFLGLTRKDVKIVHDAGPSAAGTARKGSVTASIQLPACASGCTTQVWTASANGFGRYSRWSQPGGARTESVTVEHDWTQSATAPAAESVAVDVLVSDASFTTFWHSRLGSWELDPDETLNLGTIAPQPVARFGPVTIQVKDPTVPAQWRKDMQVFFTAPGHNAAFYLQRVQSGSLVTFLPNIPGATFQVSAWRSAEDVTDPDTGDRLLSQRTQVHTEQLPLSTTNVELEITKGPSTLRPQPMGTLSRATAGFAWEPTPGRIGQLDVYDVFQKKVVAIVSTAASEIPFDRLQAIGITFRDGRHNLTLTTQPGTSIDALVDPARSTASSQASSLTEIGFAFDIVP